MQDARLSARGAQLAHQTPRPWNQRNPRRRDGTGEDPADNIVAGVSEGEPWSQGTAPCDRAEERGGELDEGNKDVVSRDSGGEDGRDEG